MIEVNSGKELRDVVRMRFKKGGRVDFRWKDQIDQYGGSLRIHFRM